MEQIGPSTHEFAEARGLSRAVGDEMMTQLIEKTGMTNDQVRATIIMVGLPSLDFMRSKVVQKFPDNTELQDILLEAVMLGFGWSALVTFHKLTLDYVKLLDDLNNMKIKDGNDLPPTKEKG